MPEKENQINWKKVFFPIFYDIKNISEDSESNDISFNNQELADQKDKYIQIINLIEKNKSDIDSITKIVLEK